MFVEIYLLYIVKLFCFDKNKTEKKNVLCDLLTFEPKLSQAVACMNMISDYSQAVNQTSCPPYWYPIPLNKKLG